MKQENYSEYSARTVALMGQNAVDTLSGKHVAVFGVGGVGGYAVEALVRGGVGELTLIDFDAIAESNLNRQIIATIANVGESKVAEFEKRIDHIDVLSATEMVFHFKDGRTVSRTWEQPKRVGRPWTDEQRAKFMESVKGRYTPELRRQMSEHMKQLRKERGKAWRKEK